jgi:chemotaxis protein MotA
MDFMSVIGIFLALLAIVGGNALEGGHIESLLNLPAALIVFGGTLAAGLLQTPYSVIKRACKMLRWVIIVPKIDLNEGVNKVVRWGVTARREGLLGLEKFAGTENDNFAKKGLQLLVDGYEPDSIRNALEMQMYTKEQHDLQGAKFYESLGGYAPTIGIIGAILGLIHVMSNLSDPDRLGPGIATAFVATVYGVASANLFFLPVANKLKLLVHKEYKYRELILEGVVAIADGENPNAIKYKLESFEDA